jgi:ribosomal protein S18 acetylase RimI-like enzyme
MAQQSYQKAYTNDSLGLPKELFSEEVFASDDTQTYLKSKLVETDTKKSWVVVTKNVVLGSVTVEDKGDSYELSGFYVLPKYQGMGMGAQLWAKVLEFASDKDITLDIYSHNTKTIDMYKKWGFEIDTERGTFFRHWPEWPEGVQAESLYMRRATPSVE